MNQRVILGHALDDWITAGLVSAPFALAFGVWVNAATWWPAPVTLALTAVAQGLGKTWVVRRLAAGRI